VLLQGHSGPVTALDTFGDYLVVSGSMDGKKCADFQRLCLSAFVRQTCT
jgi:hypothetical protein